MIGKLAVSIVLVACLVVILWTFANLRKRK
jgi:hypothetical protein